MRSQKVVSSIGISLLSLVWSAVALPNFIVFQPDDLDFYEDWVPPPHFDNDAIAEYPSDSVLPNMAYLRTSGVQMTQAYAESAMCGTSRYSTMTGRFASRSSRSRNRNAGFDVSEVTIPKTKLIDSNMVTDGQDCASANAAAVFKENGYATGVVGKWHLGVDSSSDHNYTEVQEYVRACQFDFAEAIYKENLSGDWAIDVTHNMEHITAEAIEFIEDDELVEITPNAIRLRKRYLDPHERKRMAKAS